jgi:photosystem II stability/assembly factor-like uncharacterized protein
MFRTYIGTPAGVYRCDDNGLTQLGLAEHEFEAIYAFQESESWENDIVLAGSYGQGIFRSADSGATWTPANKGLTAPALRTIVADPTRSGAIICGAEPGRGFRSVDGGQSWQEMAGISAIPGCSEWYLPYSPRAGALRNFYSPPGRPESLFASIEVGGLLYSPDGGQTWEVLDTRPDDDIHYITGHPQNPDVLWLALGWAVLKNRPRPERASLGGLARSDDGGQTWIRKIQHDYTRAAIVPPTRPDLTLAAPAQEVGHSGRIVVSADEGETWQPAGHGLETPMEDMVELFLAAPDGSIWAICSAGRLLRAEPGEWRWQPALDAVQVANIKVSSVSFVRSL